jgi:hypothetical protein
LLIVVLAVILVALAAWMYSRRKAQA